MSKLLRLSLLLTTLMVSIAQSTAYAETSKNNFLVLSDPHLDYASTNSMEINPSMLSIFNDLDQNTFENIVAEVDHQIKTGVIPQPKFVLVLGDIVGHIRSDSASVLQSESAIFRKLRETFPATPILYTFGNNDSFAVNYGAFTDTNNPNNNPYAVAMREGWFDGFLSTGSWCDQASTMFPCLTSEDKVNGYYSAKIENKFRLISLNSVMFSPRRSGVTAEDTAKQFQWLDSQLAEAKRNGEMALITMHIPPGNNVYNHSSFWNTEDLAKFLTLVKKYHDNIAGIIGAHTHAEEVKIIKEGNNILAGVYLNPAMSTSHGNAPAVKSFDYDQVQNHWTLTNYQTFGFSLQNNALTLSPLYSANSYYCSPQTPDLKQCLNGVTIDKMKKYFTAGNKNFAGVIKSPEDLLITQ